MPLYEYRCGQCGRLTEKIQKFSDPELTVCPHCGGPLARTLNAPAVHFSGGGWYKDLYSSPKPASGSAGEASAGSGGDSSADKAGTPVPATEAGPKAPAAAASTGSTPSTGSTGSTASAPASSKP